MVCSFSLSSHRYRNCFHLRRRLRCLRVWLLKFLLVWSVFLTTILTNLSIQRDVIEFFLSESFLIPSLLFSSVFLLPLSSSYWEYLLLVLFRLRCSFCYFLFC